MYIEQKCALTTSSAGPAGGNYRPLQPFRRSIPGREDVAGQSQVGCHRHAEFVRMDVTGMRDHRDDDHALRSLRPVLHHQEAIDKRGHRQFFDAGHIDQQPWRAGSTALGNRLRNEVHGLDQRKLAVQTVDAHPVPRFEGLNFLQHVGDYARGRAPWQRMRAGTMV